VATSGTSCDRPSGRRGRWLRKRSGGRGRGLGDCSWPRLSAGGGMWVRRRAARHWQERPARVSSTSASAARKKMVPWLRAMGERLKQRLRLDVGREICRQYPLFCFLLLCLSVASLLLSRYGRGRGRVSRMQASGDGGCGPELMRAAGDAELGPRRPEPGSAADGRGRRLPVAETVPSPKLPG
jgi:hypothetical protein